MSTATTSPETSAAPGTTPLPGTTLAASTPATYPRKADGSVNWRAMVQPQFLYVKAEFKEPVAKLLSKPIEAIRDLGPEDIVKVPDRMLVVRKAGILELARLRGFISALPDVKHVQRDYVVVQTWIEWAPFEGQPARRSGGVGEACPENCTTLGAAYLAATAENRALARGVRQFLEIDIVCSDELGAKGTEPESETTSAAAPAASAPTAVGPAASLEKAAREAEFTFTQIKEAAQSRWDEDTAALAANAALADDPKWRRRIENDPAPWAAWADVPGRDCVTLITLIKAAVNARKANGPTPTQAAATAARKPRATKVTTTTSAAPVPAGAAG